MTTEKHYRFDIADVLIWLSIVLLVFWVIAKILGIG